MSDTAFFVKDKPMWERVLFWKLAFTKVTGKAMLAGANSIVSTLNGTSWDQFTSSQQFVAYVSAYGAIWMVIDAFLDNTMHELKMTQSDIDKVAAETTTSKTVSVTERNTPPPL